MASDSSKVSVQAETSQPTTLEEYVKVMHGYRKAGEALLRSGDLRGALNEFYKELAQKQSCLELASLYNLIGSVHLAAGDTYRALYSHQLALATLKQVSPQQSPAVGKEASIETVSSHGFIGACLSRLDDFRGAVLQHLEAIKILTAVSPNSNRTAVCYHKIGASLEKLGDVSQAILNYRAALRIYRQLSNYEAMNHIQKCLGVLVRKRTSLLTLSNPATEQSFIFPKQYILHGKDVVLGIKLETDSGNTSFIRFVINKFDGKTYRHMTRRQRKDRFLELVNEWIMYHGSLFTRTKDQSGRVCHELASDDEAAEYACRHYKKKHLVFHKRRAEQIENATSNPKQNDQVRRDGAFSDAENAFRWMANTTAQSIQEPSGPSCKTRQSRAEKASKQNTLAEDAVTIRCRPQRQRKRPRRYEELDPSPASMTNNGLRTSIKAPSRITRRRNASSRLGGSKSGFSSQIDPDSWSRPHRQRKRHRSMNKDTPLGSIKASSSTLPPRTRAVNKRRALPRPQKDVKHADARKLHASLLKGRHLGKRIRNRGNEQRLERPRWTADDIRLVRQSRLVSVTGGK